jgi:hypothetical protein
MAMDGMECAVENCVSFLSSWIFLCHHEILLNVSVLALMKQVVEFSKRDAYT